MLIGIRDYSTRKVVSGTSPDQYSRGNDPRGATPRRVSNAAEQMRNTSPYGSFRGYVPQPTGAQQPLPYADLQGNGQRGSGRPASAPEPKKKRKAWLIIFLTVIAIGVIAGASVAGVQISRNMAEQKKISDKISPYNELYCPGVYVDGIHLGGMTPTQAMNSVQSQINQRNNDWSVKLVYEGNVVADINAATLNMNVDQNQLNILMNEAWLQGHSGNEEERYAQMEYLESTPYVVYTARPTGNTGEIDRILAELKSRIDLPAQDAAVVQFVPSQTSNPFIFSHEVVGRRLDTDPLKEELYRMVSTMTGGTVELKPEVLNPVVTQAELEKHYALRATAVTPIDRHSTEDRNKNIERCFQLISGTVIQPGKTFSFNKIVGARTIENGFYPAIEYINDEHVEGIGGGACQASTTVYQAAVCAGMQIVSRRPHSDSVSYSDYGKDATVYMGGKQIDLVFKNNTDEPIYITAAVETDTSNRKQKRLITKVNIYGKSLENVTYTLETVTTEILPSIMEPVYVKDKESAGKAKDGCIVNSYRMTYTNGTLTNQELLFTDTYKPKPEKIYDPNR